VLTVSWDTVRLFLHVLAATVWVGGQLTLAALVPALRRFGTDVAGTAARRFNQVAWTAIGVLIVTGIWNIVAVRSQISHSASYRTTLIVKLAVVVISGITAALHIRSRTARSRAVLGALTGLSALAALFLGVLLGSWASCWPAEQPLDRQRSPLAAPAGILGFTPSSTLGNRRNAR
jgi:putative copper export protein